MKITRLLASLLLLGATPLMAAESGDPVEPAAGLASGAWPDSVELALPPAPAGSAPRVALVANHATVDGPLGSGWLLAASRVITRRGATGGVPGLTSADQYLLDGQRLILLATPTRYEPEVQDGSRLDYDSATNSWTLRKDGWTSIFGTRSGTGANATQLLTSLHGRSQYTPNPILNFAYAGGVCPIGNSKCNTVAWHLSKVTDPQGNVAIYDYTLPTLPGSLTATYWQESVRAPLLTSISYAGGNASVTFAYGLRPALRLDVSSGTPTFLTQRLDSIEVAAAGNFFSRYELAYVDQGGTDCQGALREADATPRRVALARITETGAAGAAPRHTLRCLEYAAQSTAWQSSASVLTATIDSPTSGGYNVNHDWGVPLPLNLNGDGVSDLVVLGFHNSGHSYAVNHRAYVATPGGSAPFATSTGSTTANLVAAAWENMVRANLPASSFDDERSYAFADFDRDSWPELMVEMQSGSIAYLDYQPVTRTFNPIAMSLDKCDLHWGSFVDVDGDGFVDLVRRAHGGDHGCAATTTTTWLRNSGASPWLSNASPRTLQLPMEAASYPADFQAKLDASCGGNLEFPDRVVTTWTDAAYLADHARFGDFNGDRLIDVAYAVYGCWEDQGTDGWHPIEDSAFSRIYFGDGYGYFMDARLGAGPAFTLNTDDSVTAGAAQRIVAGYFQSQDLDGDGISEVLSTQLFGEVGVTGGFQRGLVDGFGFAPISDLESGTPWDLVNAFNPPLPYVGAGYDCHKHAVTPAIADFDGDGFADVLTLEFHDSSAPPGCSDGAFCALMRKSTRTTAEGRLIASTGSWGGRTALTWSFSARAGMNNPDLPANLEVLGAIDGAGGHTTLRYGGATFDRGAPTNFSTVERVNARGGTDTFGYAITPALAGQLLYATRKRTDGTLEHATVYLPGQSISTGFRIDATPPFFNPIVRQCDFELGYGLPTWWGGVVQSVDLTALIAQCGGWGKTLGGGFTAQLRALTGFELRPPAGTPAALVADRVWGRASFEGTTISIDGTGSTGSGSWSALPDALAGALAVGLRWSVPAELADVMPALFQPADSGYPAGPAQTEQRFFLTDWSYEITQHYLQTRKDVRDTATGADDLTTSFTWQQPDSAGLWFRLLSAVTRDPGGAQQSSVTRSDFAFFDVPRQYVSCGTSLCSTHGYSYAGDGTQLTHTRPDLAVERWTRNWCGLPLTYTDAASRVTTTTYDGRCLPLTETKLGVVSAWDWDALRRVTTQTVTPNGGNPAITTTTAYDDSSGPGDDSASRGPRVKELRGDGRLELRYLDGFGRPTRTLRCKNSQPGGVATAACDVLTLRAVEHTLYGSDGLPMLTTQPYALGELPAATLALHDGFGRTIARRVPTPGASSPSWRTARTYFTPGAHETIDPMGIRALTAFTTLGSTDTVGGLFRGRTTLNRRGDVDHREAADGVRTDYSYDGHNRVASIRLPSVSCVLPGGTTATCIPMRSFGYDALGRVTSETLPDGTVHQVGFDAVGRITSRKIDGVAIETVAYQDGTTTTPSQVTRTDEAGSVTTEDRDGMERLLGASRLGLSETRTYGQNGLLKRWTDGDGLRHDYTYDVHGRLKTVSDPATGTSRYTWDGADRLRSMTDADGVVDGYTYTYAGLPLTQSRGAWTLLEKGYDDGGRPSSLVRNGVRSSFEVDDLGRISIAHVGLSSSNVSSSDITIGYDSGDRVLTRTVAPRNGTAATTTYSYGPLGWLDEVIDPEGGHLRLARDVAGRVRIETDAENAARVVEYDERSRVLLSELRGHGAVARSFTVPATRGTQSNLWMQEITDGDGSVTRAFVDSLGRAVAVERADGGSTTYEYDGSHLRFERVYDAAGVQLRERRFRYEGGTGRLWRTLGPDVPSAFGGSVYTIERAYTAAGRLASLTMPDDTTTFGYVDGMLASEEFGGLTHTLVRNDPRAPWVTEETLVGSGQVRRHLYGYDDSGRLLSDSVTDGSSHNEQALFSGFDAYGQPSSEISRIDGALQVAHTWTFDRLGRPTRRVTSTPGVTPKTTQWSWFKNSALQQVTTPSGVALAYDYGAPFDHKLRRVYDPAGPTYASFNAWNGRGQPTDVTLPLRNTNLRLGYDAMGRMVTRAEGLLAMPPQATWSGHFDTLGRLSSEDYFDSGVSWQNHFLYDGMGHLIEEQRGRSGVGYQYTLDAAGNRLTTSKQQSGGPWVVDTQITYSGVRVASVNGASVSHDDWNGVGVDQHGNQFTRTPTGLEWTITSASGSLTRLKRDARGIPIGYDDGNGVRVQTFGLNPGALPLEMQQPGGGLSTYVTGGGLLLGRLDGATFRVMGQSQSGTMTRSNGQTFDDISAFGVGGGAPADERYRFAGLLQLPSVPDVLFARLRAYDPETGRFLSPDPSGLAGGPHRFLYADGDPVQKSDPMGLSACSGAQLDPQLPMLGQIEEPQRMDSGASDPFAWLSGRPSAPPIMSLDLSKVMQGGGSGPFGPISCQTAGCQPEGGEGAMGVTGASEDSSDPDSTETESDRGDEVDDDPYDVNEVWVMTPDGKIVNDPTGGGPGDVPLFDAFGPSTSSDPAEPVSDSGDGGDDAAPRADEADHGMAQPSTMQPGGQTTSPVSPQPEGGVVQTVMQGDVKVYSNGRNSNQTNGSPPTTTPTTPPAPPPAVAATTAPSTPLRPTEPTEPRRPTTTIITPVNNYYLVNVVTGMVSSVGNEVLGEFDLPLIDVVEVHVDIATQIGPFSYRFHDGHPTSATMDVTENLSIGSDGISMHGEMLGVEVEAEASRTGVKVGASVELPGVTVSTSNEEPGVFVFENPGGKVAYNPVTGKLTYSAPTDLDWDFLRTVDNGDGSVSVFITGTHGDDAASVTVSAQIVIRPDADFRIEDWLPEWINILNRVFSQ